MKWWIVPMVALAGCVSTNVVTCQDGRTCPEDTVCVTLTNPAGELCALDEQLTACTGKNELADCTTLFIANGRCYEGVCLEGGCGNGRMDPGELCDDANQVVGDGCSYACQSDETCGNGYLDVITLDDSGMPQTLELCDDGSRFGHDGCAPSCRPEQADWSTTGSTTPGIRRDASMAYDAYRGRVVMFGGGRTYQTTPALGDTWQWDGTSWSSVATVQSPDPRHSAVMAYDSSRRRVVLFGGVVTSPNSELWELDNQTWRPIAASGDQPPPRFSSAMVYDNKRKRLVVFGGLIGDLTSMQANDVAGDTWEFDGTTWTETAKTSGPPARWGHAMVYDPVRDVIVMTGGYATTPAGPFQDTWEYAAGTWQMKNAGAPANFALLSAAFDPISQTPIVFGGQGSGSFPSATYSWNGAVWSAMAGSNPPGRINYGMATDYRRGRVVLYAGQTGAANTVDEVWERGPSGWTQVTPQNPPTSMYAGAAFAGGKAILFGGTQGLLASSSYADTWLYDGLSWRKGPVGPTGRMSPAMAGDTKRNQVVLFGGYSGFSTGTIHGDTWIWTGLAWAQQFPTNNPPARWNSAMAYDSERDRMVLFAGETSSGTGVDTWEWDGTDWANVTPAVPTNSPPARNEHMMAYDPVRKRVVMFGGGSIGSEHEAWEWDGTVWTKVTSLQNPPTRSGGILVWNPTEQALVMYGGRSTSDATWERRGTEWGRRYAPHEPTPRAFGTGFQLPDGSGIGFLGGVDPDNLLADATPEMSFFRYTSFERYETCFGDLDNDGDGAAGCDDSDCWSRCSPACRPGLECDATAAHCGDGSCGSVEDCRLCPEDCASTCPASCGDGFCDPGETAAMCPGDC